MKKPERYKPVKRLGAGGFGTVFECIDQKTNLHFAMKRISCIDINEANEAMSETQPAFMLRHDNVLKLVDFFIDAKDDQYFVCLIMPLYSGGDLATLLQRKKASNERLPENRVESYIRQLASAIQTVHQNRIMHRDLKAQNILLTQDHATLVLADFGLSREIQSAANTRAGTEIYMAPEILNGKQYKYPADMWSLGCIIYEIMTLDLAVRHNIKALTNPNYSETVRRTIAEHYSPFLADIVARLLSTNPEDRITADELLQLTNRFASIEKVPTTNDYTDPFPATDMTLTYPNTESTLTDPSAAVSSILSSQQHSSTGVGVGTGSSTTHYPVSPITTAAAPIVAIGTTSAATATPPAVSSYHSSTGFSTTHYSDSPTVAAAAGSSTPASPKKSGDCSDVSERAEALSELLSFWRSSRNADDIHRLHAALYKAFGTRVYFWIPAIDQSHAISLVTLISTATQQQSAALSPETMCQLIEIIELFARRDDNCKLFVSDSKLLENLNAMISVTNQNERWVQPKFFQCVYRFMCTLVFRPKPHEVQNAICRAGLIQSLQQSVILCAADFSDCFIALCGILKDNEANVRQYIESNSLVQLFSVVQRHCTNYAAVISAFEILRIIAECEGGRYFNAVRQSSLLCIQTILSILGSESFSLVDNVTALTQICFCLRLLTATDEYSLSSKLLSSQKRGKKRAKQPETTNVLVNQEVFRSGNGLQRLVTVLEQHWFRGDTVLLAEVCAALANLICRNETCAAQFCRIPNGCLIVTKVLSLYSANPTIALCASGIIANLATFIPNRRQLKNADCYSALLEALTHNCNRIQIASHVLYALCSVTANIRENISALKRNRMQWNAHFAALKAFHSENLIISACTAYLQKRINSSVVPFYSLSCFSI